MRFFILCAILLLGVGAHPTRHYEKNPQPLKDGELPAFRSFHIHVIFNRRRSDDRCVGYDNAMQLRERMRTALNVSANECQGDFDQNQYCMFPVAMGPFGPFPVPEFALYVPKEKYAEAVPWIMQNRGPFSVFVHPNSGFERNDHSDWAMWGGASYPLDLSDLEFSPQLPPLFNTSCRSMPPIYPFPTGAPPLSPSNAHIRLLSFQPLSQSQLITVSSPTFSFPAVSHYDTTWYLDTTPSSTPLSFCTNPPLSACVSTPLSPNQYYTFIFWQGQLLVYADNNTVGDSQSKIRFLNLLTDQTILAVKRDGNVIQQFLKPQEMSNYDEPSADTQHMFEFVDVKTGQKVISEPYYTNSGSVNTIIVFDGKASVENTNISVLLTWDFPHDSPL